MDGRLQKEKDFHNQTFQEHGRQAVDKYYVIARRSHEFYTRFLQARCNGRRVLEYGCGPGSYAFFLARHGASVVGIDISDVAIAQARQKAQGEGLAVDFQVMDAEQLGFQDGTFDLVCGTGILHHLTLDRAFSEIARVLDDGGAGIFIEALGHNPLINLYRCLTPHLRTEDEHPLRVTDLALAKQSFPKWKRVSITSFHFWPSHFENGRSFQRCSRDSTPSMARSFAYSPSSEDMPGWRSSSCIARQGL